MVRMKKKAPEYCKIYHYQPGQTAANTKILERSMGLIVPQNIYDRFAHYAKENERVALLAEREAKRLAALKDAIYDMSKSWEDTPQKIKQRREKELLVQKEIEEAERKKNAKEMAIKIEAERAEVVKQAKQLLLYRRPYIRVINRGLLLSECLREREEQIKFQAFRKEIYDKLDEENTRLVLEDVKKFNEQEQKKRDKIKRNAETNKKNIIKQIKEKEAKFKSTQEMIKKCETEDLKNMIKEANEINANELQLKLQKKVELKQMLDESMEDKKQYDLRVQEVKEFQDKSLNIYVDIKRDIEILMKRHLKNERLEKVREIESLARRLHKFNEKKRLAAEEKQKKLEEEEEEKQKIKELKMIEEKKQKRIKAHQNLKEQIKNVEEEQNKRKKEERDIKLWETLQRYKRDEFNKECNLQQMQMDKEKRLRYGKILKIQMAEKDAEKKKAAQDDDYHVEITEMMNKSNQKILEYGEKLLEESQGVRPIYPIAKAIQQFKKETGLIPSYQREEDVEAPSRSSKNKRDRLLLCTKPMDENNIFYL